MIKQDILSIIVTLIAGIFAGFYLYVTGFAPWMSDREVPDRLAISEFSIVGDVYGGCRSDCPSFQVQNNGSYRYIYVPETGADQILRQGSLPLDLRRDLKLILNTKNLAAASELVNPASCDSYVDGIDILYDVTLDGERYFLDSCGTAFYQGTELWEVLDEVWDYLGTL